MAGPDGTPQIVRASCAALASRPYLRRSRSASSHRAAPATERRGQPRRRSTAQRGSRAQACLVKSLDHKARGSGRLIGLADEQANLIASGLEAAFLPEKEVGITILRQAP